MQFKIDENLPNDVAETLRNAGHDALTIHDQQMTGDPDPEIAAICQAEERALLTLDLDFADIRNYPPADYHGLIVLRPHSQAKQPVLQLIQQLLSLLESEQLAETFGFSKTADYGSERDSHSCQDTSSGGHSRSKLTQYIAVVSAAEVSPGAQVDVLAD